MDDRLFIGLPVPEAVRTVLSMSAGGLEPVKWVNPDDYHITLRFIGEVEPPKTREIAARLGEIIVPAPKIEPTQFGAFGGKKPRSVHIAIAPAPALTELQIQCERICRAAGLDPEKRKFAPHITIGRLRGASDVEVAHWLHGRSYFGPPSFEPDAFSLYSAKLGGGGPYHPLQSYPLMAS